MARLVGVVSVDGYPPRRVGSAGLSGQPVEAEVVLGAVAAGDLPMLGAGPLADLLDLRAVLVAATPDPFVLVPDELGGGAVQTQHRVVGTPAQVTGQRGLGVVRPIFGVLGAGDVATLDRAGPELEARTDPRRLVVGRVRPPVHRRRRVRHRQARRLPCVHRWCRDAVGPVERPGVPTDAPSRRR